MVHPQQRITQIATPRHRTGDFGAGPADGCKRCLPPTRITPWGIEPVRRQDGPRVAMLPPLTPGSTCSAALASGVETDLRVVNSFGLNAASAPHVARRPPENGSPLRVRDPPPPRITLRVASSTARRATTSSPAARVREVPFGPHTPPGAIRLASGSARGEWGGGVRSARRRRARGEVPKVDGRWVLLGSRQCQLERCRDVDGPSG